MIEDSGKSKLREATVSGIFYPEDPGELGSRVAALLDAAKPPLSDARFIVSPHAGFDYSGDLSALAWKAAAGTDPRVVIVIAPLHRAEESLVYLPESDLFDSPLGPAAVDRGLVEELLDCGTIFALNDIPHLEEHGIEVQLPFMRRLFPEARLVPLIMGKPSAAMARAFGAALGIVFGPLMDECLFVISTDLVSGPDAALVRSHSDRLIEALASGDSKYLLKAGADSRWPVCGGGCLAAFLASPFSKGTQLLVLGRHDSSRARQSGDERFVEYMAAAFAPRGQA